MKIKVCGMRDADNILNVAKLAPHYMGFIFYKKSIRFVKEERAIDLLQNFPAIKKVGVFVDAKLDYILQKVHRHGLSHVQLHGKEQVNFCQKIKKAAKIRIIKAVSVTEDFNFSILQPYQEVVDYLLFDTKCSGYGGSGITFNWNILKNYNNQLPIFLSGGLSLDNIQSAKKLSFLKIHALDLNSCFEKKPALKDIKLLQKLDFLKI